MSIPESTPRQNLARWTADRGYPSLRFRPHPQRGEEDSIGAGPVSWDRFLATACDRDIDLAVVAAHDRDRQA